MGLDCWQNTEVNSQQYMQSTCSHFNFVIKAIRHTPKKVRVNDTFVEMKKKNIRR